MRVTHVITRLIVGGAQENTIASVLGLRDRWRIDADLVSGPTVGPEGSLEASFEGLPGVLNIIPELVRPLSPVRDFIALRKLEARFRRTRPEIVHTHSGKAGILGRLAAARAGVPVIIHTIHGPSFGDFQGAVPNYLYRAAERRAGRCTTHFVVVANAMAEQYLRAGIKTRNDYTRIFSGFPLEPFLAERGDSEVRARYGLSSQDVVIGKVARLFQLKGHDDLMDVIPDILRSCPNARFLLVGGGEWRERLEAEARARNVLGSLRFTGLVPPAQIPELVGIMDVLVHLSRREGLARALPQAMAAGKPVVAYDCDGANEVCLDGETGYLIRPGDRAGLVGRITDLARDTGLRRRLGESGREYVRTRFPVERMVDELAALYERLAAAKHAMRLGRAGVETSGERAPE